MPGLIRASQLPSQNIGMYLERGLYTIFLNGSPVGQLKLEGLAELSLSTDTKVELTPAMVTLSVLDDQLSLATLTPSR